MNDQIDNLATEYRDIEAPPHLLTRIRADVRDRPSRKHGWLPAGATMMAVLAAIWLLPDSGQQPAPTATATKPSLTAIASLRPRKPTGTIVSLTRVRTVKRPPLPAKPRLESNKPQTKLKLEIDLLKEKDHAHS